MSFLGPHLFVVPILLPMVTAALLLVLAERDRRLAARVNLAASGLGLVIATTILEYVHGDGTTAGRIGVYLASNWEAPFGIVLVADRLAALMLVLVGIVSACAALHAEAGWSRAGVHFHPLFQIQLMGLNGAFLTGDLFNLFVFFEVMLAASYGLQLHGSGWPRVRSGLHYTSVNLLASALFLVGLAVLYGVMGTLNMADVADKLPLVPERDRGLLHAGCAILAVAFLVKAAIWPLNAWLVPAYTATSAPVAALFALMTKVGFYALLRLWTLLFSSDIGASSDFGRPLLLVGGLATLAFGTLGLVASLRLGRIAAFAILVSSGTLLATLGVGSAAATAGALFYLPGATMGAAALFLLVELVERIGTGGRPRLSDVDLPPGEDTNLDDEEVPLVGRAFPVSLALLGLAFMTIAMVVAGLPPLSGFLGKIALLGALLRSDTAHAGPVGRWTLFALLILSGLASTISLARTGIRHFWSTGGMSAPRLKPVEVAAVLTLGATCVFLSFGAEPVVRYARVTAAELHAPTRYVEAVLSTKPRPGPTRAGVSAEVTP